MQPWFKLLYDILSRVRIVLAEIVLSAPILGAALNLLLLFNVGLSFAVFFLFIFLLLILLGALFIDIFFTITGDLSTLADCSAAAQSVACNSHVCPPAPELHYYNNKFYYLESNSQTMLDYYRARLECFKTHILEKEIRPRRWSNLWLTDWETIWYNEDRARDIAFIESQIKLLENDLASRPAIKKLDAFYYAYKKSYDWHAYYARPILAGALVLFLLAIYILGIA